MKQGGFVGSPVLPTVYNTSPLIYVIYFNDKCIFNSGDFLFFFFLVMCVCVCGGGVTYMCDCAKRGQRLRWL